VTKQPVPTRRADSEAAEVKAVRLLDAAAAQIQAMWLGSLESEDFDEVTRLAEASQAIHRARLAMERPLVRSR
jgi:hypothetical protein